ncbi:Secreted protein, suppressor for copper-sensitivity ScsC [hydrothermal vent metagenome]|uniref:Secreted protein, suppressor for copper-sensitivity ScsC n=1 Tax=hydrothermal vent metagenome TaxID=652676 RepID=A0A1W1C7G0_9ZZZZ
MSLMSKLLMSSLIATVTLSAAIQPDNQTLVKYVRNTVVKNPNVKVKGVTVLESKTHKALPGWTILLTTMDLNYRKKEVHVPKIMFIKDGLVAEGLVDLKTGKDYKDEIKPTVSSSYYNDAHLLFGNKDAKHKILVFSDPQCPFCKEVVPDIIKAAKENPSKIALYYYHLPLVRIHPVSDILTKIMHVAQEEGKMDMIEKMYALKIKLRERDVKKVLAAVKKQTGYVVSAEKINAKEVKDALKADTDAATRMMVSGTPTVYIDGKWDRNRDGYKNLIK